MADKYDVVIVGAGPAGMAAATTCAGDGLSVLALDEQPAVGGQIYRNIEQIGGEARDILGPSYLYGISIVESFRASDVDYQPSATVWRLDADGTVYFSFDGAARVVHADRIILTTGAMERPVAFPGSTLPGVMTAGGAQILLKSASVVPDGRVVLAGAGPLLLLVAQQLINAGANVVALLETTSRRDYTSNWREAFQALKGFDYLKQGLIMRRAVKQAGVEMFSGIKELQASGDGNLASVSFTSKGQKHDISADLLLVHDGVIPNVQATRQAGCDHIWNRQQRYWQPRVDEWGATSIDSIAVAGDTGAIIGARAAELSGRLVALDTICRSGRISLGERFERAVPLMKAAQPHLAVRPLLNAVFQPSRQFYCPPDDDTIVCRCEEVTAGELRGAIREGAMGPNQLKAYTRCGMGPCQGRSCGLIAAEIIAEAQGKSVADVGYFRIRPPLKPVPLSELAAMEV